MTIRDAFEKGTDTFNSHDLKGFADTLADEVVFQAPGGIAGQGKAACVEFFGSWFGPFPDARVQVHALHVSGDAAVEEGTFIGTHQGVFHGPTGDLLPTGRSVAVDYLQVLRIQDGRHVSFNLMFDRLDMLEQLGVSVTRP
jgi:predicted ester cyclase